MAEGCLDVDSEDALLIAQRVSVPEVTYGADQLNTIDKNISLTPTTVHRPWGHYTVLQETEYCKVKKIVVEPHQSLSLQKHHHRSEHWIVVSGTALALVAEEKKRMPNDTVYIKAGQIHRLTNPGLIPLILIEVQCGDYLGEDDIVRFADLYGRAVVSTTA